MPAYVLVRAVDGWDPTDPMVYMTGYPVWVYDVNQIGGKQVPPKFIQFVITDATVGQILTYCQEWKREIDWEFVGHDYTIDGHRLNVFTKAELVSASGLNGLTRDKVETFLNNWGASVVGIAANSVVFDVTVANSIASQGFWGGLDISMAVFTEKSYEQATGIHNTEIDYTNVIGATPERVASEIVNRGCTVTQNATNKMRFDCGRDTAFSNFKLDVVQRAEGSFSRRKWAFTQEAIDLALANGGSYSLTRQQALAYLHNRLLD